jgi:hypothetical protein
VTLNGVEYVLVPVGVARAAMRTPGSVYDVAGKDSLCQFCPYSHARAGTCKSQCNPANLEHTDNIYVDKPTAILMVLEGS